MTPRVRQLLLLCAGFVFCGCPMRGDALRVETLGPVSPDASCQVLTTGPRYSTGFYDPTVNDAGGYALSLLMRNNMQAAGEEVVTDGPVANVTRRRRDVTINRLEGCWYSLDEQASTAGHYEIIDCATLPAQSGNLPVLGHLSEGEGLGLVSVQVLDLAALKSVFGPGYDPALIPAVGVSVANDPAINPAVANGNQTSFTAHIFDPAKASPANLATRSAAWGERHPAQPRATVMVQLRAHGETQTGDAITGDWYTVPITVCTGCMQNQCGPLVEQVCARGPCPDGTPCLSTGLCSNPAVFCSPIALYSGYRPDFYGQTGTATCLPAQALPATGLLKCVGVGCAAALK